MAQNDDIDRPLPPPAKTSVPGEIASLLRARILKGELEPGDRLPPERDLAPDLGTNRNTLREAMRTLESEGLIRARQGDGVKVLDFRRNGHLSLLPHLFRVAEESEQARILGDLLRFRAALALEIVEIAARRAKAEDLSRIAELVEHFVPALEAKDPRRIAEAELDLYRAATAASGSVAAMWVLNGLEPVVRDLLEASPELWLVADGYLDSWRKISAALIGRDGGKARRILSRLMDRGDRRLLSLLDLAETEEQGFTLTGEGSGARPRQHSATPSCSPRRAVQKDEEPGRGSSPRVGSHRRIGNQSTEGGEDAHGN